MLLAEAFEDGPLFRRRATGEAAEGLGAVILIDRRDQERMNAAVVQSPAARYFATTLLCQGALYQGIVGNH